MTLEPASGAQLPAPPDHPDTPDAPHNAWRHAIGVAAASERFVAQLRAAMGLSSNEMNALLLLYDGGARPISEIAEAICLSRAAMSALVDRLEEDGWLSRVHDTVDRRRIFIMLNAQFEQRLLDRTHAWRQRLQNHASEAQQDWDAQVEYMRQFVALTTHSARELRLDASLTRPGQ